MESNNIHDAIDYANNLGMSKEEILQVIRVNLPDNLHDNVVSIIDSLDTINQTNVDNLSELLNHVFYLVSQNKSDEAILNKLSASCNLEQFEFIKYALRYITINRIPSIWELDNAYNELIELNIEELIKQCEVIKNLQKKQIAYQIILQYFYKAFCDGEPANWFMNIANQTTDEVVK